MKIDLQPILKNELVVVRPLVEDDYEELFQVGNDPLIWEQHQNKDRYKVGNFTTFFAESLSSKGAVIVEDVKNGKIIGSSRFKMIDENGGVVEIGWSFLNREFWGGSYNRAVKKLMVNHLLEDAKTVVFYVNPKNFRSQRAMEKLGAEKLEQQNYGWVLPLNKGITYVIDSKLV